jgi:hypothetical protein
VNLKKKKHHAMKKSWGICILNISVRWKLHDAAPGQRASGVRWIEGWVPSSSDMEKVEKR